MWLQPFERLILTSSRGLVSRLRIGLYRGFGLTAGLHNRMESGRSRRLSQIVLGHNNTFSDGFCLWPEDAPGHQKRIIIGNRNYFNRNLMIDACGLVQIGDGNMVGPDVYITDSNHSFGKGIDLHQAPMQRGEVHIGNHCWIGAKAIILKDVTLGDHCVVAAGAVVTTSFPPGSMVAGVPARLIKSLS
ncbi:MAG: acyltransferase [Cyclobacteriaceae bacterium]|nr:acyltransferase [Cyclobacteriaceae bacterium]